MRVTVKLADICTKVTDGTHDSPKLQLSGVPFIKAKHVSHGQVDIENCDFITHEDHLKVISRSKPEFGDTLFVNIGASLGDCAFVPDMGEFSIKNVALFKPNPKIIDPKYLYYCVLSPQFRASITSKKSGSAQPFVGLDTLRKHELKIFAELSMQKRIAEMLSAYDDLIEVNTRRIKALEEMARRTYKEWFLKYRFPGGEGTRPNDWETLPSTQAFKIKYGKTLPKTKLIAKGSYPVFGAGGIIGRYDSKNIDGPVTLVTSRGAGSGVVWNTSEQGFVTNNSFTVIPHESGIFHYKLVGYIMESAAIKNAVGGAAQPQLTIDGLRSVMVSIPNNKLCKTFSSLIEPMFSLVVSLLKQNTNLRAQRDLLLPRLISGEIDISDAPLADAAE